jgi:pyridoxamine 5'-phosphate oxidase
MSESGALNPLNAWHDQLWNALTRAPLDKHSAFRNATLCTVDKGVPQARIVVLREVDRKVRRLSFFTDARTPKLPQLRSQPQVQWLFWDPRVSLQLRISATASIEEDAAEVARRWARVGAGPAAADYLSLAVPGQELAEASEAVLPGSGAQNHFCVVHTSVQAIDALQLSRSGHRRARFAYDAAGACKPSWLQA